jgi:hypothetical protein
MPGKVRKVSRSGRTVQGRSVISGRFLTKLEAERRPAAENLATAIPNGGLPAALERLNNLPPDTCAWVNDMPALSDDVPEVIGPRPKAAPRE